MSGLILGIVIGVLIVLAIGYWLVKRGAKELN